MSFKDFKVVETIGKGSFASVYKVIGIQHTYISLILLHFFTSLLGDKKVRWKDICIETSENQQNVQKGNS